MTKPEIENLIADLEQRQPFNWMAKVESLRQKLKDLELNPLDLTESNRQSRG